MYFKGEIINSLPAAKKVEEFLEKLNKNQIVVVEGETGSGKTQVFPALAAMSLAKDKYTKVYCTQNKRVLCEGIGFIKEQIGPIVGYTHGKGENFEGTNEEVLSFITVGSLLNYIRYENPFLSGCPAIVIDEFHEGTIQQEELLGHLHRICKSNPRFKVILMSATLSNNDKGRIREFFDTSVAFLYVKGRTFPVETKYTNHLIKHERGYSSIKRQVIQSVSNTVLKSIGEINDGTVLAFLPGKAEIQQVKRMVSSDTCIPVYTLHSKTEEGEKEQAICKSEGKKIVLATDAARSGLTLDNCRIVISSGYSRVSQHSFGVPGIRTVLTDEASLRQEAGRTGRTCSGVHYIVGKEVIRPIAPKKSIENEDLSSTFLSLLSEGFDLEKFNWFTRPQNKTEIQTLNLLKQLGAVSKDFVVTELGVKMSKLPCNVLFAKMLIEGKKLGIEEEITILASFFEAGLKFEDDVFFENDLEMILYHFRKGDVEDEVKARQQELFNILKKIEVERGYSENIDCCSLIKIAIIRTFGLYAAVYVEEDSLVDICEGFQTYLDGGKFLASTSNAGFSFELKDNRYQEGQIVIPLNLFGFDGNTFATYALPVSNEEFIAEGYDTYELEKLQKAEKREVKYDYHRTPKLDDVGYFLYA